MSSAPISPAAIAAINERLTQNPAFVSELTEDETIAARKAMSPLGAIVSSEKKYANMSITNYKDAYMRKFYLTTSAGYLFRVAEEYSPEEEIDALKAWYQRKVDKLHSGRQNVVNEGDDIELRQAVADLRKEEAARIAETEATYRDFLNRFLSRHLAYNSDRHIRKMHNDKAPMDAERRAEMIKARCSTATSDRAVETKLKDKPDALFRYMKSKLLDTYQTGRLLAEYMEFSLGLQDTSLTPEDRRGILSKKYHGLMHSLADMKKIVEPISNVDTYHALVNDPPADLTCHFDRYVSGHFEALREITDVLFNEHCDIEFSAILYDTFDNETAAHRHLIDHEKEFVVAPITIENQGQTLLGPFKENRDKINYFTQRTDLLLKMHQQNVSDQALAEDIVKKKVEREKLREIHREGPDKPGLSQLSEVMNGARAHGATKIIDKKTMEKLEATRRIAEDAAVPQKAIQVDVYRNDEDERGMPIMRREILYTAEEPPKFLEPGSPWANKYLPVGYVDGKTDTGSALERSGPDAESSSKPTKSLSAPPTKGKLTDLLKRESP